MNRRVSDVLPARSFYTLGGAFRVHAAMRQMGFDLSRAACGSLLARVREVYGYEKSQGGGGARRAMPFAASERNEVWSADVRHLDMVDEGLVGTKAYAVAVLDNYSRAILTTGMSRTTTFKATSRTKGVRTAGAPRARSSLGSRAFASTSKTSSAPSSLSATRGFSTAQATPR
jgi:transposase InsO family protein